MRPAVRVRLHSVAAGVIKAADPEERTPMLAHVLVRRADALRAAGKPGAALPPLEAALASYRSKRGRAQRVETAMEELRAERRAERRAAPPAWHSLFGLPIFARRGLRVGPEPPGGGGGVGGGGALPAGAGASS
eukprot:tig00000344_g24284.t1